MLPKIAVSLMCMDLLRFREQLDFLDAHADFLHVDIMDGHYVPNLTLSPFFMQAVGRASRVPMDTHLMTTDPGRWLPMMAEAGARWISPQAETINVDAFRTLATIRALGCKPGVVVNPATTLATLTHYIHLVDKITIMTVDPGYAGQPFVPEMVEKIEEAADLRRRKGLDFLIEVDGSCNKATYARLLGAGADVLVMGSTGLFRLADDLQTAWQYMLAELSACVDDGRAGQGVSP